MAELHARRVVGDRILGKFGRRSEDEHRLGIDESLDEPGRRDPVDVGPGPGDPSAPAQGGQIEPGLRLRLLWTPGPHGNGLLQTPHLGASGSVEEIDVADPLMLLRQAHQLLLGLRAHVLALEALQQAPVPHRKLPVLAVTGLVEELQHVTRADILDLLHPDEGGLAAVPLDLLREPLEVLVPLRGVREQVRRPLERHRSHRPQAPPDAHAQTRRGWRHAHEEQEELLLAHALR